MFSFIFGKPKASVAPLPPINAGPSDATLDALRVLSSKESDLDKRITMLTKQVDHLTAEAVTAHKAGQKTKALLAMKKKAAYEDQIKTNTAMMMKIVEQKMALESTVINTGTLAALGHANIAMKAEQAVWNADKVRDLMDDTDDVHAAHREIVEMLREPIGTGPSDDELTDELDAMMAATAPVAAPAAPAAPAPAAPAPAAPAAMPVLPAVPTSAVGGAGIVPMAATDAAELDMMRDLERIAALA
jgi:hypothetical protein